MDSLMLVFAVIASLGAGVFLAQLLCVAIFRAFRMQVRPMELPRTTNQPVPDLEAA